MTKSQVTEQRVVCIIILTIELAMKISIRQMHQINHNPRHDPLTQFVHAPQIYIPKASLAHPSNLLFTPTFPLPALIFTFPASNPLPPPPRFLIPMGCCPSTVPSVNVTELTLALGLLLLDLLSFLPPVGTIAVGVAVCGAKSRA